MVNALIMGQSPYLWDRGEAADLYQFYLLDYPGFSALIMPNPATGL
jgi:hypothetical protein